MTLSIIVAMGRNRAIGCLGRLPWHLPEDLHRFKQLTMGHTIIMGRKTFESLPHGALPGRRNVVLSRHAITLKYTEVYHSLQAALASCRKGEEVFIIGGASVYAEALALADRLYITLVDQSPRDADAFFPPWDASEWTATKKEKHTGFSFIAFRKINMFLRQK